MQFHNRPVIGNLKKGEDKVINDIVLLKNSLKFILIARVFSCSLRIYVFTDIFTESTINENRVGKPVYPILFSRL